MTSVTDVPAPLPRLLIEPVVRAALAEDLGRAGDITTMSVVPADVRATGVIDVRQAGVVAGLDCALTAFVLIDPSFACGGPSGPATAAGSRRA